MDERFYDLLKKRIDKDNQGILNLVKDVNVSFVMADFLAEVTKVAKDDVLRDKDTYFDIAKFESCFNKLDKLDCKKIDKNLLVDIFIAVLSLTYLSSYMFWKFMIKQVGIENSWNLIDKGGHNENF